MQFARAGSIADVVHDVAGRVPDRYMVDLLLAIFHFLATPVALGLEKGNPTEAETEKDGDTKTQSPFA
jgi:hypothetical protein